MTRWTMFGIGLSLVLATVTAWTFSNYRNDDAGLVVFSGDDAQQSKTQYSASVADGLIVFGRLYWATEHPGEVRYFQNQRSGRDHDWWHNVADVHNHHFVDRRSSAAWRSGGFAIQRDRSGALGSPSDPLRTEVRLVLPMWLFLALGVGLCAPPTLAAIRRAQRARSGHCLACGYDLRGSPGRCPECGVAAHVDDGGSDAVVIK